MVKGIMLIILQVINVLSLIFMIVLLFTKYYPYFLIPLFISMVLYITISFSFWHYTNKILNREKNNLMKLKIMKLRKEKEEISLTFIKNNYIWTCEEYSYLSLNLAGYLFPKSFIKAWLIRSVRYEIISEKLKIKTLLKKKLKLKNIKTLKVKFIDGANVKECFLVRDYISKNTPISRIITNSKYYAHFISMRQIHYFYKVERIDESIYLGPR